MTTAMTAAPPAALRILRLHSEDVKRVKVVEITPSGDLVFIRGKNGQGKTSTIDSISYALGGAALMPPEVIRRGAETAEVTVDIGEFIITRRWTASNSTLSVKTRDGLKYSSPQKLLDGLVGRLSFDPLVFSRASATDQLETIRKLLPGIDFSRLDVKRADLVAQRTLVNKERDGLELNYAKIPAVEAPDEPVSVTALREEEGKILADRKKIEDEHKAKIAEALSLKSAQERAAFDAEKKVADTNRERSSAVERVDALALRIQELQEELADAQEKKKVTEEKVASNTTSLETARADHAAKLAVLEEGRNLIESMQRRDLELPSLDDVRARLATIDSTNERVRAKKARQVELDRWNAKKDASKALTAQINTIDEEKREKLSKAEFPVPGLSLGEHGVTMNGLPLEQASHAEVLQVSLAVAMALNPRLRVLLIRDGEKLDKDSLELVAQFAVKHNAQVWLEVATSAFGVDTNEVGIIIEDGYVASVDGVEVARGPVEVVTP
jgi:DNA repair exonuclease SbcCD ATPase subunit